MRVFLVRHGESGANVEGVINDDPARPVSLTARGQMQARVAAGLLAGVHLDAAYSSAFPRARQTADCLLAGRALPVVVDARLNERTSGLDGQPVEAFNGLVRADPVNTRPAKGESFLEEMQRVGGFLRDLPRWHAGADAVLVVSHENPIQAMLAVAGMDPEAAVRRGVANCEVIELAVPQLEDQHGAGQHQGDGIGEDDRPGR